MILSYRIFNIWAKRLLLYSLLSLTEILAFTVPDDGIYQSMIFRIKYFRFFFLLVNYSATMILMILVTFSSFLAENLQYLVDIIDKTIQSEIFWYAGKFIGLVIKLILKRSVYNIQLFNEHFLLWDWSPYKISISQSSQRLHIHENI